jgi:hypothetical protein
MIEELRKKIDEIEEKNEKKMREMIEEMRDKIEKIEQKRSSEEKFKIE